MKKDYALHELPSPLSGQHGWPWTENVSQLPETMPDGSPWIKISVVTPSYNQQDFLEETLRSVLLQGYPNLEYFVMDGGSTDGSPEIIKKYEPYLTHWVSEHDHGQSHAINKGFARSTGGILCWINSDDMLQPGALAYVAHMLKPVSNAPAWLIGASKIVDKNGNVLFTRTPDKVTHETFFRWIDKQWFPQQSTFWTRPMWESAGPLDESLHYVMDLALWWSMFEQASPILSNQVLSSYRQQDQAKTLAQPWHSRRETLNVFYAYLKKNRPNRALTLYARRCMSQETLGWASYCYSHQQFAIARQYVIATLRLHFLSRTTLLLPRLVMELFVKKPLTKGIHRLKFFLKYKLFRKFRIKL